MTGDLYVKKYIYIFYIYIYINKNAVIRASGLFDFTDIKPDDLKGKIETFCVPGFERH